MRRTLFLLLLVCLAGCTKTSVQYGGAHFSRVSFGNKVGLGLLSVTTTNGTTIRLEGYDNDSTEGLRAVSEGLAAGLAKGFNPVPTP